MPSDSRPTRRYGVRLEQRSRPVVARTIALFLPDDERARMRQTRGECPSCGGTLYESYDGDVICGSCAFRVRDPTFVHPRERYAEAEVDGLAEA